MKVDFFGDKMSVMSEILDTDYETYLIGYECFDQMQFTLGDELEPVHYISMGIASRDANEGMDKLEELEEKALELMPFLNKEDFAKIEQGDEAQCEYRIEF